MAIYAGDTVTFTPSGVNPGLGETITEYLWIFDGIEYPRLPVAPNLVIENVIVGTYYAELKIVNSCGAISLPKTITITVVVPGEICDWITGIDGWNNLNWTNHVLKAYYVYIGAPGYTIEYSPVTWDSVLGLYYYYIGLKDLGNSKTGCEFT